MPDPSNELRLPAPAKVNLFLELLGKRPDGYHELETLLVTIGLFDEVVFRPQEAGTNFTCGDASAGDGANNLVMKAVQLVRDETGITDGIDVELIKRIPVAAGLAGGSSDAATTLMGLNQWWKLGWSQERLAELGARLGSDVPFFFYPPAAIARGRGERVTACSVGVEMHFVVVWPMEGLSTAKVFANVTVPSQPVPIEPLAEALASGTIEDIARLLHNRLEEASLGLSPAVRRIRDAALTWPCQGRLMSGSGSAYFGLCDSVARAEETGRIAQAQNLGKVFVVPMTRPISPS